MPTLRDHINVCYSPDNTALIADIPDLKYCSAHGRTPEEAVREVLIAQRAWLATARSHGTQIPPPRCRPAIYQAAP